ncbi:hypothetical protein PPACK8108_LOCUS19209 [Phakopsora pachyrhizi]|uniref:Uncharacterized protein n=1 Tax=Phakopsora pachyrhizi TaxID=170000 RepID=A0AAV0BBR0_PHAPC|nr:hypothetical protein PPACK8108_LOCUS19209 [Phakopsora pachyrhizi]
MTDEVVMLKGKRLFVTVPGGISGQGIGMTIISSTWKVSREIVFVPEQLVIGTVGVFDLVLRLPPLRLKQLVESGDVNIFEVDFRNDLMDSPPAVDWKAVMVVVAVTVDDRTNDWVKLMRAMVIVVIDWYQC